MDLSIAPYDDTMLLSYMLAAGLHGHGLDELAELHFKHKMISYDDVTGSGKTRITFDRVPLDKATDYAAEDADYALRLWQLLKPQIAQQHVTRVYERIERPLVPVVADMETIGVRIDPEFCAHKAKVSPSACSSWKKKFINSPGILSMSARRSSWAKCCSPKWALQGGIKGKTGAYSTSVRRAGAAGREGHEIVAKVLEWRSVAKLKSTYTDALPEQIGAKTGRVHTSYSMVGAATGRLGLDRSEFAKHPHPH